MPCGASISIRFAAKSPDASQTHAGSIVLRIILLPERQWSHFRPFLVPEVEILPEWACCTPKSHFHPSLARFWPSSSTQLWGRGTRQRLRKPELVSELARIELVCLILYDRFSYHKRRGHAHCSPPLEVTEAVPVLQTPREVPQDLS